MRHNPIRRTVAHFIEACGRPRRKAKRQPKKSNFVRYFESLENRGPDSVHESLHGRWTRAVRAEMEAAGTWLSGEAEWSLEFIAEYVSRLQRQFWLTFPRFRHDECDMYLHIDELRPALKIFRRLYNNIRTKGMRDWTYELSCYERRFCFHTVRSAFVYPRLRRWNGSSIAIRPYRNFCDHGADI